MKIIFMTLKIVALLTFAVGLIGFYNAPHESNAYWFYGGIFMVGVFGLPLIVISELIAQIVESVLKKEEE